MITTNAINNNRKYGDYRRPSACTKISKCIKGAILVGLVATSVITGTVAHLKSIHLARVVSGAMSGIDLASGTIKDLNDPYLRSTEHLGAHAAYQTRSEAVCQQIGTDLNMNVIAAQRGYAGEGCEFSVRNRRVTDACGREFIENNKGDLISTDPKSWVVPPVQYRSYYEDHVFDKNQNYIGEVYVPSTEPVSIEFHTPADDVKPVERTSPLKRHAVKHNISVAGRQKFTVGLQPIPENCPEHEEL